MTLLRVPTLLKQSVIFLIRKSIHLKILRLSNYLLKNIFNNKTNMTTTFLQFLYLRVGSRYLYYYFLGIIKQFLV